MQAASPDSNYSQEYELEDSAVDHDNDDEDPAVAQLLTKSDDDGPTQRSSIAQALLEKNSSLRQLDEPVVRQSNSFLPSKETESKATESELGSPHVEPIEGLLGSTSWSAGHSHDKPQTIHNLISKQLDHINSPRALAVSKDTNSMTDMLALTNDSSQTGGNDGLLDNSPNRNAREAEKKYLAHNEFEGDDEDETLIGSKSDDLAQLSMPDTQAPSLHSAASAEIRHSSSANLAQRRVSAEERALEESIVRKKLQLQHREQRDHLEEEEYLERREVEDDEKKEGFVGSGRLSCLYDNFVEQTDAMDEEDSARGVISLGEGIVRNALLQQLEVNLEKARIAFAEETAEKARARILGAEGAGRDNILELEEIQWLSDVCAYKFLASTTIGREHESRQRREIASEEESAFLQLSASKELDFQLTVKKEELFSRQRQESRDHEASSRQAVVTFACGLLEEWHLHTARCAASLSEEAQELGDIRAAAIRNHEAVRVRLAVAVIEASLRDLSEQEADERKAIQMEEWDHRKPMHTQFSKKRDKIRSASARSRKPPVPAAPRKITLPTPPQQYQPPRQDDSEVNAYLHWSPDARASLGRPKLKKVAPLPLRKLPFVPLEDSAFTKRLNTIGAQILASQTDEQVGRKSIMMREEQQWLQILSDFRETSQALGGEQQGSDASKGSSRRSGELFRCSQLEYDRFVALRDHARRTRMQNEEKFRLQSLVARLISVDIEFDLRNAKRAEKKSVTAVKQPRPPFACDSSEGWDVIPRLSADNRSPHKLSRSNTARPSTAADAPRAAPRPPRAPATSSARPQRNMTFAEKIKESLIESSSAVSLPPDDINSPERATEATTEHDEVEPSAHESHHSSPSRSSSSVSASSRSSSSASSLSRASTPVNTPRKAADNVEASATPAEYDDDDYEDEQFESPVASPEKANGADGTEAPADDMPASPQHEMGAKEEVVHSLIADPVVQKPTKPASRPSSAPRRSSQPTQLDPSDIAARRKETEEQAVENTAKAPVKPPSRSTSPTSTESSSSGSWHPMASPSKDE